MSIVPFKIGGKSIGAGFRPLIIAEMSANHNGSLEGAMRIVRAAAECGADAIKLQTFTAATLTIDSRRPEFFIDDPENLWHGRRLWELYEEAHTPWEWHEPIFKAARDAGMACISTAFDAASVEFLLSMNVDAIKIASFELVHIPLIEAAARTGKPVLLSTGMSSQGEIEDALLALRENGCERFVLLKCTSAYPSTEGDANILTMEDLRQRYRCEVGLSDHTLRPYTAFAATSLGAVVIEKHFTIARAEGGLDSAFSLEPRELRELVDGTELVWRSLGEVRYEALLGEATSMKERPSIYVVRSIKKGEKFTEENLRIIRPANGLPPRYYRSLIGKSCAHDVDAEVPMSWNLVLDSADSVASPAHGKSSAGERSMSDYLEKNAQYWAGAYDAPNVESFIFRFYGRILRFDYGIDGSKHERVLDFGCGQGGALNYFDKLGFDCYGVDIAPNDIAVAQRIMPHVADHFAVIDPKPDKDRSFFGGGFDIVISIQTLDFLSNSDFDKAIRCLYNNMKPGAKIYASMNGWNMYYRNYGTPADDGLWHIKFKNDRVNYDLYLNFVKSKDEMREKFSLFKPVYLDHYDSSFREEGSEFRYTFFGIKE